MELMITHPSRTRDANSPRDLVGRPSDRAHPLVWRGSQAAVFIDGTVLPTRSTDITQQRDARRRQLISEGFPFATDQDLLDI